MRLEETKLRKEGAEKLAISIKTLESNISLTLKHMIDILQAGS